MVKSVIKNILFLAPRTFQEKLECLDLGIYELSCALPLSVNSFDSFAQKITELYKRIELSELSKDIYDFNSIGKEVKIFGWVRQPDIARQDGDLIYFSDRDKYGEEVVNIAVYYGHGNVITFSFQKSMIVEKSVSEIKHPISIRRLLNKNQSAR